MPLASYPVSPEHPFCADAYYRGEAHALLATYEAVSFDTVHADLLSLLPDRPGRALDVGAGSGRDAGWLARRGWRVLAVEPSEPLLQAAQKLHRSELIEWRSDRLPELRSLDGDDGFDLILASAVWMHLPEAQQSPAFDRLASFMRDAAILNITVRMGPAAPERGFFHVDPERLKWRATAIGLRHVSETTSLDSLGREEVSWLSLIFRRDG